MNNRVLPVFLIIFLVLAGMIVFIDIKKIPPDSDEKMPDIKDVIIPENNQGGQEIDVYYNTKETIKKRGRIEEKNANTDTGIVKAHNPFLFPEEILLLKLGKEKLSAEELDIIENKITGDNESNVTPNHKRFHLSMIMMGEKNKIALVNQNFIIEGDVVEDYTVEKISKNSITLANKQETKEIFLEPDFVPLMHKSSSVRNMKPAGDELKNDTEVTPETGNLKKQLQDVLKMYDQGLN